MEEAEEDVSETLAFIVSNIQSFGKQLASYNKYIEKIPEIVEQFKYFRDEIKEMRETLTAYRGELYQAVGKQVELEYEMGELRKLQQTDTKDRELEERLEAYMKDIYGSLEYHQYYLEQIDNQTRDKNLIFHGIDESNSSKLGSNDKKKIKNVINETGLLDIRDFSVTRLGQNHGHHDKPRPILVKVDNHETQKTLLTKAKVLKDKIGYSNIYIKKDLHHTVRKELNRLRKREIQEKQDPMNSDVVVKFDLKDRVLRVNGLMIDKFNPSFK